MVEREVNSTTRARMVCREAAESIMKERWKGEKEFGGDIERGLRGREGREGRGEEEKREKEEDSNDVRGQLLSTGNQHESWDAHQRLIWTEGEPTLVTALGSARPAG